jgi:hypothetical protein
MVAAGMAKTCTHYRMHARLEARASTDIPRDEARQTFPTDTPETVAHCTLHFACLLRMLKLPVMYARSGGADPSAFLRDCYER